VGIPLSNKMSLSCYLKTNFRTEAQIIKINLDEFSGISENLLSETQNREDSAKTFDAQDSKSFLSEKIKVFNAISAIFGSCHCIHFSRGWYIWGNFTQ
jgi:hypothetical protein